MTQVFGRGIRPRCLNTAQAALEAGISLVPVAFDGSKRPLVSWKQHQQRLPDQRKVDSWFKFWPQAGLAFVTGEVSQGLEAIDFDDLDSYKQYTEVAQSYGLSGLVNRVERGYLERTPKGVHWLYRCPKTAVSGNQKLAAKVKSDEKGQPVLSKEGQSEIQTLIETRGEGGYLIVAPSGGFVHPSGNDYQLVQGGVSSITTLTSEERHILLALARSLDQLPKPPATPRSFTSTLATTQPQPQAQAPSDGLVVEGNIRPGDDFNARATWHEVLSPAGWRWLGVGSAGEDLWQRPGKNRGVSATTNLGGLNLLHVFSTSTRFQTGRGQGTWYSKFGAYALLYHNGDWKAAAKELRRQGYGCLNSAHQKEDKNG